MSPSPTAPHQDISLNLAILLKAALAPPAKVIEGWAWKPGSDEFIPDLMVLDIGEEAVRYSGTPHLSSAIDGAACSLNPNRPSCWIGR